MLKPNMSFINDPEGENVPAGLPPVIDTHVHIFPDAVFSAIWKWFDAHAWRIRYRMDTSAIFDFLLSRGVGHIVALQYAHKPGIARMLNQYMVEKQAGRPGRITGMATVFPGEKDDVKILDDAFDAGLKGLKLHVHVQCFDINGDDMGRLYERCLAREKPIVMHAGREPKSEAYPCDPYQMCAAEKIERVLKDFPGLKICVPHLGFDETSAYRKLIEKYDHLWLDTAMTLADYFPSKEKIRLGRWRPDRVMHGSDFPNIPYAWDRELKALKAAGLSRKSLERISGKNALEFFDIE
ncbi:Amidohydrolase [Candidatus Desulfarcum epimagneticum]|uniref:Amidohydrolase n=1 Tax=uncultured Desulfobacteraceae bacterium TaxID=218296 RepID=A0A484HK54_9BACT|nr:Amidohydrolase [uncultured Desulfobacteraceae bacterium]